MNSITLMVHYGELSTKGNNKSAFIKMLAKNVRQGLKKFPDTSVRYDRDHLFVTTDEMLEKDVISRLQEISGIQKITPVYELEKDLEIWKKKVIELLEGFEGKTFKCRVKRVDKTFPLHSYDVAVALADEIIIKKRLEVDLHNPDVVVSCEIREKKAYLSSISYPGAGGYPLGMNGKAMMLLSGGIDSPVASYLLLRRGVRIECLHFAAPPYTSSQVIYKLEDLIAKLGVYQESIRLHIVPFTKLQVAIYDNVDESYCITIMRRMMLRIAERYAKKRNCLAIATGESIGQVASQTLASMEAINEVTSYPIIRPLACTDKLEVISLSQKIDTFDISIRPYEDCCTIFKPKNPTTKPKAKECAYYESKFDYEPLIEECLANIETRIYKDGQELKLEHID